MYAPALYCTLNLTNNIQVMLLEADLHMFLHFLLYLASCITIWYSSHFFCPLRHSRARTGMAELQSIAASMAQPLLEQGQSSLALWTHTAFFSCAKRFCCTTSNLLLFFFSSCGSQFPKRWFAKSGQERWCCGEGKGGRAQAPKAAATAEGNALNGLMNQPHYLQWNAWEGVFPDLQEPEGHFDCQRQRLN